MKKLFVISIISLLSLPVFSGNVSVKNCLKVNYQKVCFPHNYELYKALKDEKNSSKVKQCFKNFMKNKLLNIKLKEHDLYYFQAERNQGAEITIVFSKHTKEPKMNIDGVHQVRRGTLVLPDLGKRWCHQVAQTKIKTRTEKLVNEFYFDSRSLSSIPQHLFDARNGIEFECVVDTETQSIQTRVLGSGEAEYTQPQQCLPDEIKELVTNVQMTTEANCHNYAEAMVKLSAREDGTVPTNNGESVYDSNKSLCEFNNHSIRSMKEKVNSFLNFCEYGGSIVDERASETTLPNYKFFVNGRKINLPRFFSMPGYPDDITLEQSLEIFRLSEEENIPSDLLFSLAKISPRELKNILPQLHNQLEWIDKVIRDAQESDGQEEGQSEGYQNFDSYTEDEDGNIFDPAGNLVTDEATIEGYYQSHTKKPRKYENQGDDSSNQEEPSDDDEEEPSDDNEEEPSDEEDLQDDSNLGEENEEDGEFEDEEEE